MHKRAGEKPTRTRTHARALGLKECAYAHACAWTHTHAPTHLHPWSPLHFGSAHTSVIHVSRRQTYSQQQGARMVIRWPIHFSSGENRHPLNRIWELMLLQGEAKLVRMTLIINLCCGTLVNFTLFLNQTTSLSKPYPVDSPRQSNNHPLIFRLTSG